MDAQIEAGCPGVILDVQAPSRRISFREARGLDDRVEQSPLATTHSFRIASVTKTVTAATAASLAAEGRMGLDDSVDGLLDAAVAASLREIDGLGDLGVLTPRRLLDHTSGLPDYFFDARFQQRVASEPDRSWRPEDLVEAAAAVGKVTFPPRTSFAYADTGYVVMGLALQELLGCPLHEAYRSIVFDPLGMDSTYLEFHEPMRGAAPSHHYDGARDLRSTNLSFDWSGGGLVSTTADLARFLRGLFGCVLFDRPWLDELTAWRSRTRWRPGSSARYLRYGLGLGTNLAFGEEIAGATGVWGAFAYYWPAGDATITGTVNATRADRSALLDEVLRALVARDPR